MLFLKQKRCAVTPKSKYGHDDTVERTGNILLYHLMSIVILLNIFQQGLNMFGVEFNIALVEYVLIFIIIVIYRRRFCNWYNAIVLISVIITLLLSMFLFSGNTIGAYFKDFIIYAAPLLIIFMFDITYRDFTKILFRYSIIGVLLYIINIICRSPFSSDYMTFGYGGIFCSLFMFIYSAVNGKRITGVIGIICCFIFVIYGPRGGILTIVGALLLLLALNNQIRMRWKAIVGALLAFLLLFSDVLVDMTLNFVNANFDSNLYTVRQLNNMQEVDGIESLLSGRYDIYENAISEINENPVFGIGIGSFQEKNGFFPHNIVLDIYVTFGIIFGTICISMIFGTVWVAMKKGRGDNSKKVFCIFCISMSLRLLLSKTFIYDPYFWLLIASSINIIYQNSERMLLAKKMFSGGGGV